MIRTSAPAAPVVRRASRDRWIIGYADVVTLLLACFASLYAQERHDRPPSTAAAVTTVAPPSQAAARPAADAPPAPPTADAVSDPVHDALRRVVKDEMSHATMDLADTRRGIVISLAEAGSFTPGRAELSTGARQAMLTLAAVLRPMPNAVRVEGHTDDVPIHNGLFTSNWELSTARATRVVELLIDDGGLDPARLSAAGYADYRPRVPNDSMAARARNRRVDIVVLDGAAAQDEPGGVR